VRAVLPLLEVPSLMKLDLSIEEMGKNMTGAAYAFD
jgi:hypothetical protein